MSPGTVASLDSHAAQRTVVVVISIGGDTARVSCWNHRVSRWCAPIDVQTDDLGVPDESWPHLAHARNSIRRNHGVIPCGGTFNRYVRVWPGGVEPKPS